MKTTAPCPDFRSPHWIHRRMRVLQEQKDDGGTETETAVYWICVVPESDDNDNRNCNCNSKHDETNCNQRHNLLSKMFLKLPLK